MLPVRRVRIPEEQNAGGHMRISRAKAEARDHGKRRAKDMIEEVWKRHAVRYFWDNGYSTSSIAALLGMRIASVYLILTAYVGTEERDGLRARLEAAHMDQLPAYRKTTITVEAGTRRSIRGV